MELYPDIVYRGCGGYIGFELDTKGVFYEEDFYCFYVTFVLSAFALEGTVISTTGKVECRLADGEWIAVKAGDTVPEGAVISTALNHLLL